MNYRRQYLVVVEKFRENETKEKKLVKLKNINYIFIFSLLYSSKDIIYNCKCNYLKENPNRIRNALNK